MCGIVAIMSQGGTIDGASMGNALRTLHHRGPDGHGTWTSARSQIVLGHTRLSIIDLSTGDQPIPNEDESACIVVNGEFYDYERVQRDLERGGHHLRTRSDSEIALHLYEDYGTQCVHHLRGEYAFVLWDERARKLIAVRDRYGVKPLFYARHRGVLFVASEMKALFAAGVPARWDAATMYFSMGFMPPGRTQFEGVHSVPPGYYLTADADNVTLTQYWDTHYPIAQAASPVTTEAEYIEGFRSVLDEAVRVRLRADVPVGCYLSGGLDSCAVLGLAAKHRTDPIRAFTLRFDHEDYDEGVVAREMAHKAGADWVPIPITQQSLADNFSDAIYFAESPCVNAHFVGKYLLSRAVRDAGFKVVLTGEGSDEVLAGYPHFRLDMLKYDSAGQDPAEIWKLTAALADANKVSKGILLSDEQSAGSELMRRLLGFVPAMYLPVHARVRRMQPLLNADYFAPFQGLDIASLLLDNLDVKGRLTGRAPVHQSLYLWSKTILPGYILTLLGDRMEMAHSIEGRVPFLDHKVGEFLFNTPVNLKIRGRVEKLILREATRDVITDTVYRRQKHPFLSPPDASGVPSRMSALIQDTLRSTVVDSVPFLDGAGVRNLADRLGTMAPEERGLVDGDVMVVVSQIIMHERFVQGGAA
ncbi:MAG: asparagine synthase (glutamine-hydrolyzing) [Pseudomonadota bacterium]